MKYITNTIKNAYHTINSCNEIIKQKHDMLISKSILLKKIKRNSLTIRNKKTFIKKIKNILYNKNFELSFQYSNENLEKEDLQDKFNKIVQFYKQNNSKKNYLNSIEDSSIKIRIYYNPDDIDFVIWEEYHNPIIYKELSKEYIKIIYDNFKKEVNNNVKNNFKIEQEYNVNKNVISRKFIVRHRRVFDAYNRLLNIDSIYKSLTKQILNNEKEALLESVQFHSNFYKNKFEKAIYLLNKIPPDIRIIRYIHLQNKKFTRGILKAEIKMRIKAKVNFIVQNSYYKTVKSFISLKTDSMENNIKNIVHSAYKENNDKDKQDFIEYLIDFSENCWYFFTERINSRNIEHYILGNPKYYILYDIYYFNRDPDIVSAVYLNLHRDQIPLRGLYFDLNGGWISLKGFFNNILPDIDDEKFIEYTNQLIQGIKEYAFIVLRLKMLIVEFIAENIETLYNNYKNNINSYYDSKIGERLFWQKTKEEKVYKIFRPDT